MGIETHYLRYGLVIYLWRNGLRSPIGIEAFFIAGSSLVTSTMAEMACGARWGLKHLDNLLTSMKTNLAKWPAEPDGD